jgi:hypothetical protein
MDGREHGHGMDGWVVGDSGGGSGGLGDFCWGSGESRWFEWIGDAGWFGKKKKVS